MGFIAGLFGAGERGSGATGVTPSLSIPQYDEQALMARQGGAFYDAATQQALGYNRELIDALKGQASGQGGPSIAERQLVEASNRNLAQTASLAGSQRGVTPAMMARMIGQQQGQLGQQTAASAATLRAQEQATARQQLGQAIAQQAATSGSAQQLMAQKELGYGQMQNQGQKILADASLGAQGITAQGDLAYQQYERQKRDTLAKNLVPGYGMLYHGGMIPGDHPANDIVPAMLSPGEIVIPRSIAMSDDAGQKAKAFVEAIQRTHKPHEKVDYKYILASRGE